jgi:hypothetical protein
LLILVLLTAGQPSRAENPLKDIYRAQELYNILKDDNRYLKYFAIGYITGVAFRFDDLGTVCIDKETVDHLVLTRHIYEYLRDHEKQRKKYSNTAIRLALEEAYPCK